MIDANTKEYREVNGKVTGIKLQIYQTPNQKYYVDTLALVDENTANGKTICTFFVEGQKHKCWLGYPFSGDFVNRLPPGGSKNEHVISNGFNPKDGNFGPLSIYVGDEKGNVISEIVRGFGLPNNHHVSFVVGYKLSTGIEQPKDLESRVVRLEKQMQILLDAFEQMQGEI